MILGLPVCPQSHWRDIHKWVSLKVKVGCDGLEVHCSLFRSNLPSSQMLMDVFLSQAILVSMIKSKKIKVEKTKWS